MITKDEITMDTCSYALFLKEMLTFRYTVAFPRQDFFPDISLTVNNIPDISLTCFKFPDISRFSRQVVTLNKNIIPVTGKRPSRNHCVNENVEPSFTLQVAGVAIGLMFSMFS